MAKSIRSKVKKRNRTEMRKKYGEPHAQQLAAKCTARLQETVQFHNGAGIAKLKSLLNQAQADNPLQPEVPKHGYSFRHPHARPDVELSNLASAAAIEVTAAAAKAEMEDGSGSPVAAPGVADLEAMAEAQEGAAPEQGKRVGKSTLRAEKLAKAIKNSRSRRKKMMVGF